MTEQSVCWACGDFLEGEEQEQLYHTACREAEATPTHYGDEIDRPRLTRALFNFDAYQPGAVGEVFFALKGIWSDLAFQAIMEDGTIETTMVNAAVEEARWRLGMSNHRNRGFRPRRSSRQYRRKFK